MYCFKKITAGCLLQDISIGAIIMAEEIVHKIICALKIYRVKGKVHMVQSGTTVKITVNGKYYGIWDITKKTFID